MGLTDITPLREFLKVATAAKHDEVDARYAAFEMTTRKGYTAFLAAHYLAWQAMAEAWSAAVARILHKPAPDYAAMLRDDLDDVDPGLRITLPPPQTPQQWTARSASSSARVGLVYVLAGSRLGTKSLARLPNWGAENARANRYLNETCGVALFLAAIAYMDGPEGRLLDQDEALQAAFDCFALFSDSALTVMTRN